MLPPAPDAAPPFFSPRAIRALRLSLGLSKRAMGRRLGLSARTVDRVERAGFARRGGKAERAYRPELARLGGLASDLLGRGEAELADALARADDEHARAEAHLVDCLLGRGPALPADIAQDVAWARWAVTPPRVA